MLKILYRKPAHSISLIATFLIIHGLVILKFLIKLPFSECEGRNIEQLDLSEGRRSAAFSFFFYRQYAGYCHRTASR